MYNQKSKLRHARKQFAITEKRRDIGKEDLLYTEYRTEFQYKPDSSYCLNRELNGISKLYVMEKNEIGDNPCHAFCGEDVVTCFYPLNCKLPKISEDYFIIAYEIGVTNFDVMSQFLASVLLLNGECQVRFGKPDKDSDKKHANCKLIVRYPNETHTQEDNYAGYFRPLYNTIQSYLNQQIERN